MKSPYGRYGFLCPLLVVLALVLAAPPASAARDSGDLKKAAESAGRQKISESAAVELGSDYVEVAVSAGGCFTMATRIGDPDNPDDDNKRMLYGHPSPWSSAVSLRVDGADFWNYDNAALGAMTSAPSTSGGLNTAVWSAGGVTLTQQLRLVSLNAAGLMDTLEMRYVIQNSDAVSHTAGVRLMLDTWLGVTDGAQFRVPGLGGVTYEQEAVAPGVPPYWQGFDSLSAPSHKAQGTLLGGSATPPDRIVFAAWPNVNNVPWDYTINPSDSVTADSAVVIYWNPRSIAPGQSATFVTYYGLGGVDLDTAAPLAVGLTAPDQLTLVDGVLTPNPFTLTAYLENSLAGVTTAAEGVYATVTLPSGLSFAPGSSARQELGTLELHASTQASWGIVASGQPHGTLTYQVEVGATGKPSKTLSKTIEIPEPPIAAAEFPLMRYVKRVTADGSGLASVAVPEVAGAASFVQCGACRIDGNFITTIMSPVTLDTTNAASPVVRVQTEANAEVVFTLILQGGSAGAGPDMNGDGSVNASDLMLLLHHWHD